MATNANTTARKAPAATKAAAPKPAAPKAAAPKAAAPAEPKATEAKAAEVTANAATPAEGKKPKRGNGDLFDKLAAGAKEVDVMPATPRGGKQNPLTQLVQRSFTEKKAFALDPIANDPKTIDAVKAAVRRAAARNDLGVNLSHEVQADGMVVIYFKGKVKAEPTGGKAKADK
ncbi:hypothetical protein [Amycolatopsis vastitatis]|uniref:Uncharacterized protein n=1 Tax=Amycolatopsis vastitatis TaxID=1905142 RepID=A0A229TEH8_9PSEU|nr:hypothetical protein [Amycolatopsis vastitatis]OXM69646.1 hypothetical protein CF165_09055 [Amycolatopsis vastitatis]